MLIIHTLGSNTPKIEIEDSLKKIIKNYLCRSRALEWINFLSRNAFPEANVSILATLAEKVLLYGYQNRGNINDFEENFWKAYDLASQLIGQTRHRNAEKIMQEIKHDQIPFQQKEQFDLLFMKRVGRLIYLFDELPNQPKFSKNDEFSRIMLETFGFSIKALLYVVTSLFILQKENHRNFTIDYFLKNRDPKIKLPAPEQEIRIAFNTFCWSKEKHDSFKAKYANKISLSHYPIVPYKKNSEEKIVLFCEALLFELPQFLISKIRNETDKEKFSGWFGKILEKYIIHLIKDACKGQVLLVEKDYKNLLKGQEKPDLAVIEHHTAIIMEVKFPIFIIEKNIYGTGSNRSDSYISFDKEKLRKACQQILSLEEQCQSLPEFKNVNNVIRIIVSWGDVRGIYLDEVLKEFKEETGKDFYVVSIDQWEDMQWYLKHEKIMFQDIPSLSQVEKLSQHLENQYGSSIFNQHFLGPYYKKYMENLEYL